MRSLGADDQICQPCLEKHGIDPASGSWWPARCRSCGKLVLCAKLSDFAKQIEGRPLQIGVDEDGDICLTPAAPVVIKRVGRSTKEMQRVIEAARVDEYMRGREFVIQSVVVVREDPAFGSGRNGEFLYYKVTFCGHPEWTMVTITAHFALDQPDMTKVWSWDDIRVEPKTRAARRVWVNGQRYMSPAIGVHS